MTNSRYLARLLALMAGWWQGERLAALGREYGISRQRVAAILSSVGCTRALWCRADHERRDSGRTVVASMAAQARAALLHPLSTRLTVRQRAALAWQAQGLVLSDIARRMGTTPQNVRNLQVAAHRRLDRLSRANPTKHAPPMERQEGSIPVSPDTGVSVAWRDIFAPPAAAISPEIHLDLPAKLSPDGDGIREPPTRKETP